MLISTYRQTIQHAVAVPVNAWAKTVRWRKEYALHLALLLLTAGIALQGRIATSSRLGSLLYTLIANEEVIEGPLDRSAYAQGEDEAEVAASNGGFDISFTDPEVSFASVIGGNAVLAPMNPLGSVEPPAPSEAVDSKKPQMYTVAAGDTVSTIASRFNVSTDTILSANGLTTSDTIQAGDHLTILPVSGVLHQVRSGDTVSELAKTYDIPVEAIIEFNQLGDEAKLAIGEKVLIPGGKAPTPRRLAFSEPVDDTLPVAPPPDSPESLSAPDGQWVWPTTSRHLSQGFRWGHTGIDIDNRSRPPVYAANAGKVEFAGWLGGYGKLIIVTHGNGLQTYYAHMSSFAVSPGQAVEKGQALGMMGSTGRSSGPHLHFEVRKSGRPINPMGIF